jgi:hypothetical protein
MISYDLIKDVFDLDNPLTLEYFELCSIAYEGKGEKHHILPRKLFPQHVKSAWNLVKLPYRVHYSIHELLPSICLRTKDRASMSYAWNLMYNRFGEGYISQERYEELKSAFVESISGENSYRFGIPEPEEKRKRHSERMTGSGNPMHGLSGELSPAYGFKHSEEEKQRRSNRIRGENNPMYGKPSPMRGKKTSPHVVEKQRDAMSKYSYVQYSLDGIFIKLFEKLHDLRLAGMSGGTVHNCVSGRVKTAYKSQWAKIRIGEPYPDNINAVTPNKSTQKYTYKQYTKDLEFVKMYLNLQELRDDGFNPNSIISAVSLGYKHRGFI